MKTVQYRRKRNSKTDYKKRLKLLLSNECRFVVRPTQKNMIVQIVEFSSKGDKVLVQVNSSLLVKFGWTYGCSNLPSAYLTGYLAGLKAKQKGIKKAIFDIGLNSPIKGSRIFAALKGAVDAKLDIPYSEEIIPSLDRISGEHIVKYADELKSKNKEAYEKQFSHYLKNKLDPSAIKTSFNETLKKMKG